MSVMERVTTLQGLAKCANRACWLVMDNPEVVPLIKEKYELFYKQQGVEDATAALMLMRDWIMDQWGDRLEDPKAADYVSALCQYYEGSFRDPITRLGHTLTVLQYHSRD